MENNTHIRGVKRVKETGNSILSHSLLLLFTLILILPSGCSPDEAPSPDQAERFMKVYGGANDDLPAGMEIVDDGSFLLLGTTYSTSDPVNPTLQADIYMVKTDLYGAAQWSDRFDFEGSHDFAHDLAPFGSKYVLLNSATDTATNHQGLWVFDIDIEGNSKNEVAFSFAVADQNIRGSSILAVDDGFVILGTTTWVDTEKAKPLGGFVKDSTDLFLAHFSHQGDTLWSRRLGFEDTDKGVKLRQQANGNYAILGQTDFGEDIGEAGYF